jgi:MFS family permease
MSKCRAEAIINFYFTNIVRTMATRATSTPDRTIDDFLGQLYREYKLRLPLDGGRSVVAELAHRRRFRHYFPLPLLALCIANSSDATEILMLSYLLANPTFRRDMLSDESDEDDADDPSSVKQAEYLAASIFFGMLIGGTLLGFLSDHIGRRPALLVGLVINATAGLFSSFPFLTPTIAQLVAWRFFAGIGIGATVPSLFSLTSEWCPKEVRGAVVTFVASFWMVGSLFVSGLGWVLFGRDLQHDQETNVVPTWRIFAALCAMPSALGAFMVYYYVPESPRFLASTKRKYDKSACVVSGSDGLGGCQFFSLVIDAEEVHNSFQILIR